MNPTKTQIPLAKLDSVNADHCVIFLQDAAPKESSKWHLVCPSGRHCNQIGQVTKFLEWQKIFIFKISKNKNNRHH